MIAQLAAAALAVPLTIGVPGAPRPAGPTCQPVTIIMDSGNGAQVSGHMCGGLRRHPEGSWLIYVDGVSITGLSANFLMFARHIR